MSRRFSNLQYISIGILFGTCVFLWTRKLNLTKTFPSNAAGNFRQVARNENEQRLIDSLANRIEDDLSPHFEDDEEIVNGQEENSNDQIRPKEAADLANNEAFSVNSLSTSKEVEEVVDEGSSKSSPNETVDEAQSPEPVEAVSDTVDTQTENTVDSEDNSSDSSATSNGIKSSISTTMNSVMNSPRE